MLALGRSAGLAGLAPALAVATLASRSLGTALAAAGFAESYPAVKLTVNGKEVSVPEGSSILTACQQAGAYVPTLCTHPRLPTTPGTCRVCLVSMLEGRGQRRRGQKPILPAACRLPAPLLCTPQTLNFDPLQVETGGGQLKVGGV